MQIQTEQDMIEFCERANENSPFTITLKTDLNSKKDYFEKKNQEMIDKGIIGKGSHLQQGIESIKIEGPIIYVDEVPYLYPSGKLLSEHPTLTGPITGNLSNCYDTQTKRFLFHMRGTNISAPFGFQAAAAGMGRYEEHPCLTAFKEVQEEAGIDFHVPLFENFAHNVLPFMKAGKIPQPLFSYGFSADLSEFPVCQSLDDIAEFETKVKQDLRETILLLAQKEAYHFTIPYSKIETITGELNDQKKFCGPIYESTIDFIRALKDEEML